MAVLYKKVNYLLSTVYPDYDNDTGFMRGNLTRLTVGDSLLVKKSLFSSLNLLIALVALPGILSWKPLGGKNESPGRSLAIAITHHKVGSP